MVGRLWSLRLPGTPGWINSDLGVRAGESFTGNLLSHDEYRSSLH